MDSNLENFCTSCNKQKTFEDFYKAHGKSSKNRPIGRKSHCKDCVKEQRKIYYSTPKGRKYAQEKSWRENGFNFTVEEYEEKLIEQGGTCAICNRDKNKNGTRLCVDHDHTTGQVRGLLCHDCNTSLGKFNDDTEMLQKAIDYIKMYKNEVSIV
jgi:predicted HNH restriction endonuclease